MELCNDGHNEIVYQTQECPLCTAKEEIETLSEEIDSLREEMKEKNEEILSLQEEIELKNCGRWISTSIAVAHLHRGEKK